MLGKVLVEKCLQKFGTYGWRTSRWLQPIMSAAGVESAVSESGAENVGQSEPESRKNKRKRNNLEVHRTRSAKRRMLKESNVVETAHEEIKETTVYCSNGLRHVRPYSFIFKLFVKDRWKGTTVGEALTTEFRTFSNELLRDRLEAGRILVNGERAGYDRVLRNNDVVASQAHRHEPPVSSEKIQIIHEDESLLVVNKPSSIPVHPSGAYRHNTVVMMLKRENGMYTARNAHRLDRLTSGVLLMPKTYEARRDLMVAFAERKLQKVYLARVMGEFPLEPVTVDAPLGLATPKYAIVSVEPDGKPSQTRFERISYNGHTSIVKCWPTQGRMHQIRVHLRHIGHPIINDPLYNHAAWEDPTIKGADSVTQAKFVLRKILCSVCGDLAEAEQEYQAVIRTIETKKESAATYLAAMQKKNKLKGDGEAASVGSDSDGDDSCGEAAVGRSKLPLPTPVPDAVGCGPSVQDKAPPAEDTNQHAPSRPDNTVCENSASPSPVSPSAASPDSVPAGVASPRAPSASVGASSSAASASAQPSQDDGGAPVSSEPAADATATTSVSASAATASGDDEEGNFDKLCWKCLHPEPLPHPDSLVLYLHALSYESAEWKYESYWPDWAQEGFVLPEYYSRPGSEFAVGPANTDTQRTAASASTS